jgi:tRNA 2-thiouridine synthesizing protein A
MQADRTEDYRGQLCPMPIVNMARVTKKMEIGQVLEVWADDEGAHNDVPAWCQKTGNEFLGEEEADDYTRYFVKKTV